MAEQKNTRETLESIISLAAGMGFGEIPVKLKMEIERAAITALLVLDGVLPAPV